LDVAVTAYAPIGANDYLDKTKKYLNILKEPIIMDLANNHNKSPAQIILNWHIKHNKVIIIPKTVTVSRLPENFNIYDFEL
jgi:diketogulonate reductase-like aldo/keto reductase